MVASRTRKKSKIKATPDQLATAEAAVNIASEFVKLWIKEESKKILSYDPVIIPTKTGYRVGKFNVAMIATQHWQVTDQFNEHPLSFSEKRSAVLYCILYQLNRYNKAQDVLQLDQAYSKLYTDFVYYEHCIRKALKRSDMFTVDVTVARRDETKHKLEIAKNDLQKTLSQAKYIKIWDNRL